MRFTFLLFIPVLFTLCLPNVAHGDNAQWLLEENDPSIDYTGYFGSFQQHEASGGDQWSSEDPAAGFTLTFKGTGFTWYGFTGPYNGIADVYVDNVKMTSVDSYTNTYDYRKKLAEITDLPSGIHIAEVRNTAQHNELSGGYNLPVDNLLVDGQMIPRIEEDDPAIHLTEPFYPFDDARASQGKQLYSEFRQAQISLTFTGGRIIWYGLKGPYNGVADIYIDGVKMTSVDSYSSTYQYKQKLADIANLPLGIHIFEIKNTGLKHAASGGVNLPLDYLLTDGNPSQRMEEFHPAITYYKEFGGFDNPNASGSKQLYSGHTTAKFILPFTGKRVLWYGFKGPWNGIAEVYVDGVLRTTADSYSDKYQYQQLLADISGLADGGHVLEVRNTSRKHAMSGGNNLSVDYFVVDGKAAVDSHEPNNTLVTASPITLDTDMESYISASGDQDFYKFVADTDGIIQIKLRGPADLKQYTFEVYYADGSTLFTPANGEDTEKSASLVAEKGASYYIKVFGIMPDDYSVHPYRLTVNEIEMDTERLIPADAGKEGEVALAFGSTVRGYIASAGERHDYMVSSGADGMILPIELDTLNRNYVLSISKANGSQFTDVIKTENNHQAAIVNMEPNATYNVHISGATPEDFSTFAPYTLTVGRPKTGGTLNGGYITAELVQPGSAVLNNLRLSGEVHYYRFQADISGKMYLRLEAPLSKNYDLSVYDQAGNVISGVASQPSGAEWGTVAVESGKSYYLRVSGASPGNFGSKADEAYTLTVGSVQEDDHEPANDNYRTAVPIEAGQSSWSRLSVSGDQDYFQFRTGTQPAEAHILLDTTGIWGDQHYDIEVYDDNGNRLQQTGAAGNRNEFVFAAKPDSIYRIGISGATADDYSTDLYELRLELR
ncbi:hypothetical protein [Paenibacillus thalictri]|uniref:Beta-galactosidase n=1 Tax=Paenibacillus thalictri TaxID=2527873 RepID=A0A4Q9DMP7_9BACL|nr:hypothetical protein [Paenibacillus thalictri]TBL76602.1 hypothetical protein EYB31_19440 [Paenibacillus thalictri]